VHQGRVTTPRLTHGVTWKSGAPQGSIQGPILLNLFITDLGDGKECTLSTYENGMKFGGANNIHQRVVVLFRGTLTGWRSRSTAIIS